MLRSLIDGHLKTDNDHKHGLKISFSKNRIDAAFSESKSDRVVWNKFWDVDLDQWLVSTECPFPEGIIPVIKEIGNLVGAKVPCIYLKFPDTLFRHEIVSLSELPKKQRDLENILRWKLEKELYFDTKNIALDYEVFSQQPYKVSIFSVNKRYIDNVSKILLENNLIYSGIVPFSFDYIHTEKEDGELPFITLVNDYISYGIYSGDKIFKLFGSEPLLDSDSNSRESSLKRARREIVSTIFSKAETVDPTLLIMTSDEAISIEKYFNDFDTKIRYL